MYTRARIASAMESRVTALRPRHEVASAAQQPPTGYGVPPVGERRAQRWACGVPRPRPAPPAHASCRLTTAAAIATPLLPLALFRPYNPIPSFRVPSAPWPRYISTASPQKTSNHAASVSVQWPPQARSVRYPSPKCAARPVAPAIRTFIPVFSHRELRDCRDCTFAPCPRLLRIEFARFHESWIRATLP